MRETLSALALLLGVYLYLDKFLFGGRLGGLFLTGWRELLYRGAVRGDMHPLRNPVGHGNERT